MAEGTNRTVYRKLQQDDSRDLTDVNGKNEVIDVIEKELSAKNIHFKLDSANEDEKRDSFSYPSLEGRNEVLSWNSDDQSEGNFIASNPITTKLRVQNVCCGKEADIIRHALEPLNGVTFVTVSVIDRTALIRHNSAVCSRSKILMTLKNVHMDVSIIDSGQALSDDNIVKDLIVSMGFQLAVLSIICVLYVVTVSITFAHVNGNKYVSIVLIAIGLLPVIKRIVSNWRKKIFVDMNVLIFIAVIGICILKQFLEGATIVIIFLIAELMQELCMYKVRKAVSGLMIQTPHTAVLSATNEVVDIDDIEVGTKVSVREGENIPLDGIVISGTGCIDESSITGESSPVMKEKDDTVYNGTILQNGYLEIETTKRSSESTMAQISQLILESQGKVTTTEEMMRKFAKIYTPAVLISSLFVFLIPLIVAASENVVIGSHIVFQWGRLALVVLLVACPCALLMAVPMPMVCSIAACARNGLLIKGGAHLETIAKVVNVVFDKTGTLTEGRFMVHNIEVVSASLSSDKILDLVIALEKKSTHLVANALIRYYYRCIGERFGLQGNDVHKTPPEVTDFTAVAGLGMTGTVDGYSVAIGNLKLLDNLEICSKGVQDLFREWSHIGQTVVVIVIDSEISMVVGMSDAIRPTSKDSIAELRRLGVGVTMLTGDNGGAAKGIARYNEIDEVLFEMKPKDKLDWIQEKQVGLHKRKKGKIVMIGDGINDVPSLQIADVGIALATCGTALTMDSSDIVLMNDNLMKIPCLVSLSRYTRVVYLQNIFLALFLKVGILIATIVSFLPVWVVVLSDVGALMLVILSGFRPLFWKDPRGNWK